MKNYVNLETFDTNDKILRKYLLRDNVLTVSGSDANLCLNTLDHKRKHRVACH